MNALIKASENVQHRAWNIIRQTKVMDIWTAHGAEVNVVGSLAMGLMMKHLDIDLHVYSSPLTIKASFDAMSQIAECPDNQNRVPQPARHRGGVCRMACLVRRRAGRHMANRHYTHSEGIEVRRLFRTHGTPSETSVDRRYAPRHTTPQERNS